MVRNVTHRNPQQKFWIFQRIYIIVTNSVCPFNLPIQRAVLFMQRKGKRSPGGYTADPLKHNYSLSLNPPRLAARDSETNWPNLVAWDIDL